MIPWAQPSQCPKNGISISSAGFAQLTAESACTLQWAAPFPLKVAALHVDLD